MYFVPLKTLQCSSRHPQPVGLESSQVASIGYHVQGRVSQVPQVSQGSCGGKSPSTIKTHARGQSHKGTFSFIKDTEKVIDLGNQLQVHVEKINNNVGRLYFVATNQMPRSIVVREPNADRDLPRTELGFLFTWITNYSVVVDGKEVMFMEPQRGANLFER
ncbi:hypothetical protein WJX75_003590 [Coccomyxa subellipsoidea]|uniref:S1 motif domain-containing protein n=1 Tax=Coccomyxa subellipsoidea TaxID=248742 RepID=A0ABR2Z382_9CHLO